GDVLAVDEAPLKRVPLRRCPARIGRIGWLAVATQVIENPRNHCRFLDTGDHPQLPATAPTDLDVDREYAFEPLRSPAAVSPHSLWLPAAATRVLGTTRADPGSPARACPVARPSPRCPRRSSDKSRGA